ncbi:hypothetical protein A6R68_11425, partial [Neotoma lepida]
MNPQAQSGEQPGVFEEQKAFPCRDSSVMERGVKEKGLSMSQDPPYLGTRALLPPRVLSLSALLHQSPGSILTPPVHSLIDLHQYNNIIRSVDDGQLSWLTPRSHHRHVDIAQSEVVHGEVWGDLHSHGGHYDSVIPELGIVQDVGQADEGHILGEDESERGELSFTPDFARHEEYSPAPGKEEKRKHKKKRLVQSPNSYFMDVKCPGCYKITTVFSHAQT